MNTIKKIISILTLVFTTSAFSYSPTLESLFRNGNNIEVGNNTVVANISVIEIDSELNIPINPVEELANKQAFKLLINNEREDYPILTQVNYKGGVISNNSLINFREKSYKNLSGFVPNNENVDAQFFYSTLAMLLNNKSSMLLSVLKKYSAKIKTNIELINKEKTSLLINYKNYLTQIKDDETLELENPLKPDGDDKIAKVSEIKKQSFLEKDPVVKKEKIADDFFWVVKEENIFLKFDEFHRVREIKVKTNMGEIEMIFGKFVIHGAQFEFPEFIWFKDTSGRKYEIKATKLSIFADNIDMQRKRLKRYQKYADENKIIEPQIKPDFIL